jgi:SAM-dependent methyltransferase
VAELAAEPEAFAAGATHARYDGHAQWYEETFSAYDMAEEEAFLARHLGAWHGLVDSGVVVLEIGCGTGRYGGALRSAGYRVVGFDLSADQLRYARGRLTATFRANAMRMPVRSDAASVAIAMFVHTDMADFDAVVGEIARCLRPGGRFLYVGLHPCFLGPFVNRTTEATDEFLRFVPGYGRVGWSNRASGDGTGPAGRVGFHHKSLASLVGAFTSAGLVIRVLEELSGGGTVLPRNIGLVADKA